MVFINGEQVLEGIDKITVIMHPCLDDCYDASKFFMSNRKISIRRIRNRFNNFTYIDIQAEELFHSPNILQNVAHALYSRIKKGGIIINRNAYIETWDKYISQDKDFEITEDFIFRNIRQFIIGISEVEFFFDMSLESISLSNNAIVFDVGTGSGKRTYLDFRKTNKDTRVLKQYFNTIYSPDFTPHFRKSSIDYYNTAEKDKAYNQTKHSLIDSSPYQGRIEFRLTRGNSKYLAIDNIDGTYKEIIQRFTPLLSILYYKYFLNVVLVDTNASTHPVFSSIYNGAKEEKLRYTGKDLLKFKNDGSTRISYNQIVSSYGYLISLLDNDDTIIKHHSMQDARSTHNTLGSRLSRIKHDIDVMNNDDSSENNKMVPKANHSNVNFTTFIDTDCYNNKLAPITTDAILDCH
ncbi:hypothetical protein TREPR_0909 [Treponema primitia ZAS-2]|uniref:Uncharacterized protein n=1 Tax=Treponema primitia (strain ATCC BAA-887 / DSM 12427 / ZAS-2) TaxID=545694 RepID=F5YI83_TREPZ|nr:hypothetical protein [Treponema primitia]AEF85041.1 hypothetical protein TREPR_0909 [Treponema primitia ZAS-2]